MSIATADSAADSTAPHSPDTARDELSASIEALDPAEGSGLRSVIGIRWLLFVGALVVVVSLVRLVASQWGQLPLPIQFLTLCSAALGIYGAGEVAQRRLRLPVAAGALFSLFALATPVLAWGAARQDLIATVPGALAFFVGLAATGVAVRRLLASVYGYRRHVLPACFVLFVGALPAASLTQMPVWTSAIVLGAVLAFACRHINRFFFHRDRAQGIERPVDTLPFVALIGLYLANVLHLTAGVSEWALALIFVALALAEAGEEYFRAVTQATGAMPTIWPSRSRWLLAIGFATGAIAIGLAFFSFDPSAVVFTTGGAAVYLIAWTFRYRQAMSYAAALPFGLVALHTLPALFTDVRDLFIRMVSNHFGYSGLDGTVSAAATGELALLASLVAGALLLRLPMVFPRTTPRILVVHALAVAGLAGWTLVVASVGTSTMMQIAPVVAALCGLSAFLLRHAVPMIPAHLACMAAFSALIAMNVDPYMKWTLLAGINAALSGVIWFVLRRRQSSSFSTSLMFTGPILAAGAILITNIAFWSSGALLGTQLLPWVAGLGTIPILLAGLRLNRGSLTAFATFSLLSTSLWAMVDALPWDAGQEAILINAFFVATFWGWQRLGPKGPSTSEQSTSAGQTALRAGLVTGALLGIPSTAFAMFSGGWEAALGALFLMVTGCAITDLTLVSAQTLGSARPRRRRRIALGLFVLAMVPGTLLTVVFPSMAEPMAQLTLLVASLWAFHKTSTHPRWIYGIERFYSGGSIHGLKPESLTCSDILTQTARDTFNNVSQLAIVSALLITGPWTLVLLTGVLIDTYFRIRDASDTPAPDPISTPDPASMSWIGLGWLLHWTLMAGETMTLKIGLINAGANTDAFMLSRFMLGTALWQMLHSSSEQHSWVRRTGRAMEVIAAICMLVLLPSSWEGALVVTMGAAFAIRHSLKAWQTDDPSAGWATQIWTATTSITIARIMMEKFTFLGLTTFWMAIVGLLAAFACRVIREALEHRQRPQLAETLVYTGALLAGVCAAIGWSATPQLPAIEALPLLLASLYFAFELRGRHWALSSAASAFCFVAGFFELAPQIPFLRTEAYLVGPGLALLGLATVLEKRVGVLWSRRLFTLGAGCLYAVPMLAMFRELSWYAQILMLLMAVAFGAFSFHLRSRSLLLISTGAVVMDLGFFLLKIRHTEPMLLWGVGVLFGLGLMAFAAFLESRREQALQQARIWGDELRSWS